MATQYVGTDSVFSYTPHLPPREAIEAAVETLVAVLNAMDGDADEEADGDERDGNFAEDDFMQHNSNGYPGCPVSDPGGDPLDHGEGTFGIDC
jgi:hypothetical protein